MAMEVDRVVRDGGRVGGRLSSELRDKGDSSGWCVLMHRVILGDYFYLTGDTHLY